MTTTIVQNSFLPTQIPGCKLWLDAADTSSASMTLSGTSLTTWKDKSGNGLNMTAGGNYPTYTTTGVQFNGGLPTVLSNSTGYAATAGLTTFVVYRSTVAGTRQRYFKCAKNGNYNVSQLDTTFIDLETTSTNNYQGPISYSANTTYLISAVVYSAPSISWAINGTESFTWTNVAAGAAYTGPTELEIGGVSTVYFTGYIMEVIMYDAFFTQSQRQQVEGYLAWKWGLQGNLPSNHLYKNSPGVFVTQPITLASLNITNRINNAVFLPTSISGCQLWLDGADPAGTGVVPANGATVSTWKDKSGNGRDGTATGTPSYSTNVLNTLGSPLLSNTASYFTTPSFVASSTGAPTFFVVMKQTAYTGTGVNSDFFMNTSDYRYFDMLGQTNSYNVAIVIYGSAQTPITANNVTNVNATFFSIVGTTAQNAAACYTNGSLYTTTSGSGYNLTTSLAYRLGSGPGFNGYVYEALIYDNPLSTSQRQQVEGYLAWKWGLQVNLPPTHSYKKTSAVFVTQPTTLAALAINPYNSMVISRYFNPQNISGIALWLDGADTSAIQTSGSSVTQWNDKSGSGNNMTPYNGTTIGLGKLNNQSIINFGTGIMYTPAFTWSTSYTMIFVAFVSAGDLIFNTSRSSGTIYGDYVYTGNGTLFNLNNSTANSIVLAGTDSLIPLGTTVISRGSWFMLCIGYNSSGTVAVNYTINGTVRSTSVYSGSGGSWANPPLPLWISGNYSGFSFGTTQIAEVIHYNTSITTNQRQQLEGYLAWKWGIQANLPATHPYKNYPTPPN